MFQIMDESVDNIGRIIITEEKIEEIGK